MRMTESDNNKIEYLILLGNDITLSVIIIFINQLISLKSSFQKKDLKEIYKHF